MLSTVLQLVKIPPHLLKLIYGTAKCYEHFKLICDWIDHSIILKSKSCFSLLLYFYLCIFHIIMVRYHILIHNCKHFVIFSYFRLLATSACCARTCLVINSKVMLYDQVCNCLNLNDMIFRLSLGLQRFPPWI